MLKVFSKFAMDILPSVIATIIGAYIVNHYINTKPGADVPAAAVSSAEPKKAVPKTDSKTDSKPVEKSADLVNIPEPGVRAKGISEKAITDKSAADKPVEKPADKPSETASIPTSTPASTPRHQSTPREKTTTRTVPATVPPPAAEPVVAAPSTVSPVENAITPDANDLARAAIERLRGTGEASPRTQEAVRVPEVPRVIAAPAAAPVTPQPVQPLPPPIMVSTPNPEQYGSSSSKPGYPPGSRADDPRRPTPPADIPDPRPLDLRADAVDQPAREHTTVAEDVLSAAKSMFHSVLPK